MARKSGNLATIEQKSPRGQSQAPAIASVALAWWVTPGVCLGLVLVVAVPFLQVARHDFTVCDDDHYITRNVLVKRGLTWEGLYYAFSDSHKGNWHPLTWLSHMADCDLFRTHPGPEDPVPDSHHLIDQWPGGHHLMNVAFHTAGIVLLFLALRLMTGQVWPSAVVAALFAIHPLRAESVAWAAERKDVLSVMFWMFAVLAYAWYARGPKSRDVKLISIVGFTLVHLTLVAILFRQMALLSDFTGSTSYAVLVMLSFPSLVCVGFAWYASAKKTFEAKALQMLVFTSIYWMLVAIAVMQMSLLSYFEGWRFYAVSLSLAFAALVYLSFCACFQAWPATLGLAASWRYLAVMVAMAMGLMSKSMVVTLPCVLYLLDFWPMNRWGGWWNVRAAPAGSPPRFPRWPLPWLILEKVPLFALAFADCWITFLGQRSAGAMNSLGGLSVPARVLNAVASYYDYVEKIFVPTELAIFYPHPAMISASSLWSALYKPGVAGWLLMVATLTVVWFGWRRKYLITGWFWYLGTLVPVIGLIQVGTQAMADRYSYLPSAGIFMLVVWGVRDLASRWSLARTTLWVLAPAVILVCVSLTYLQVRTWKNDDTVFNHANNVTEHNYFAHCHLGIMYDRMRERAIQAKQRAESKKAIAESKNLSDEGKEHQQEMDRWQEEIDRCQDKAEASFKKALLYKPDYDIGNNCLGVYFAYRAHPAAQEAQKLTPGSDAWKERLAYSRRYYNLAIHHISMTIGVNPCNPDAHNNLGTLLRTEASQFAAEGDQSRLAGRTEEARHQYAQADMLLENAQQHGMAAVSLEPESPTDHQNLGITLMTRADFERGLERLGFSIQRKPNSIPRDNSAQAVEEFTRAISLKPDLLDAYRQLAQAHMQLGERNPDFRLRQLKLAADALDRLGVVCMQQRKQAQAVQAFQQAVQIYPGHANAQQHLSALQASP